jgi:hypothetical protein
MIYNIITYMHTLAKSVDFHEIMGRLRSVKAEDRGLWGVMNVTEMLCHLRGAFRIAMGEVPVSPVGVPIPRTILKFIALRLPLPWRKNFETIPELRRGTPIMQIGLFSNDHAQVVAELARFCKPGQIRVNHAFFGEMSFEDWMRWGYLHTDHHLRQFGR